MPAIPASGTNSYGSRSCAILPSTASPARGPRTELQAMSDDLGRQRRYKDAAPYYSRYRPPYPPAMVSTLRDTFRLDGTGLLLDLGSGPGSVAIPLAHLFSQVIAIDPEPNMLEEGRAAARRAAVANVKWVCG